jgi:hypothetical protein
MLLSKKTYREVVRNLEVFRKQHLEDRAENPEALLAAWGIPIRDMIEHVVRKNHERYTKGLAEQVLEYLANQGLLVRYVGDYTFPGHWIPTEDEIRSYTQEILEKMNLEYTR